ncbi:valine--tRNA ligase [Prevotella sp. DNF00663]|uniref:valine--tRNA ligase n=1 Tax=Prevotella sp. DNF00663 TaxID=1384078 RepID=UPI0007857196|nr:valine--tRNA ligase [Prevotella sp. DNF00663]KXB85156.1 valine--tRNA ligase [Prevotella sp. DNF00663]
MELASKYTPQEVESKWYQYWLDNKLFSSKPDGREPYTVVIPPPNVTGVLHMGHMLNNTIQDILVRRARMEGKNACWIPGTDHASIATEAKVVARLAEQGIKKTDLSREKFLEHAWDWTNEHGGIILKQLRKLGASCDWERTAFTMDETRSKGVIKVFCDLYNKGLIYRGARMVNWDPQAQTALSDEEVVYKEEHSKLYYLKYMVVEEPGKYAVVATTRPETIMGDSAMCINPNDPKNTWLKGKHVIVPLVNREIPVIEDEYVDIEFGTGCLKVTPAHDINDHALGLKHHLETIDIFNDNGTISEAAGLYVGQDRMDVRKQIAEDLEAAGLMEKVEDYNNKVGFSERTNVPIEPKLSTQWFLNMQHFADLALSPVMDDEIEFYPKKYKNTYRHWLENIKDWCISRQLWWGHRIPAYYFTTSDGKRDFVVAESAELALAAAQVKDASLTAADLEQESDCLDTWFSSWLWPISVFDGVNNPDNEEINYYYPTSDLITGPDIIFFWVARMIMAGYEYRGKMPFKHVYFTGIVRDKLGRKMSKSLGNSPDPLALIEKYGADGVRMGMMLSAPAGNDILFDESLCEQGRNFNNKIWNAFRLVKGWEVADIAQPEECAIAVKWFKSKLKIVNAELNEQFRQYRISEALMTVYRLFWDEFSSWYLEMIKPEYGKPIDKATYEVSLEVFESLLKMLHPFMPFITEDLWQHIYKRKDGESIMTQQLEIEAPTESDHVLAQSIENVKQIIGGVRMIRNQKNISPREQLVLQAVKAFNEADFISVVLKIGNLEKVEVVDEKASDAAQFMVGIDEYAVPIGSLINVEAEIEKAEAQLKHLEGFLAGIKKKLSNEKFVAHAPAQVVELERKKQSDSEEKIAALKLTIADLKKTQA